MTDLTPIESYRRREVLSDAHDDMRRFLLAHLRIEALTRKQELADIEFVGVALKRQLLDVEDAVRIADDRGWLGATDG